MVLCLVGGRVSRWWVGSWSLWRCQRCRQRVSCRSAAALSTSAPHTWHTTVQPSPPPPACDHTHRATCRTPSARSRVRNHGVIGRSHRAGDATYNNRRRTAPSPSQHRAPRTVCRTRSVAAHRWLSSNALSKLTFIIFSVFINIVFNYF